MSAACRRYAVAIYARISVDHGVRQEDSIDSQIAIAREYLNRMTDAALYGCYIDRGATGTNFHRKGFECMMQDIRAGRVNCVIVKDLSRFGRNHVDTGEYLERIFPVLGIRFISVADGYDSAVSGGTDRWMEIHLKNIVHELYAKDISEKVKSAKRIRKMQGEFVGGVAPYGYEPGRIAGKRCLIREPCSSAVVRQLYEKYDAGVTLSGLIRWLYQEQIHRPADSRKYGCVYQKEGQCLMQWHRQSVRNILTSQTYAGTLWEPLVEPELFQRVSSALSERNLF